MRYVADMALFRMVMNFVVAGALLGIVGSTLAGPNALEWYNTSGAGASFCDCAKLTRDTAERFVTFQVGGLAGGAIIGAALGSFFALRRRGATATPTATP